MQLYQLTQLSVNLLHRGFTHGLFDRYMSSKHNFADVSAKGDSQGVLSNLTGMAAGLGILSTLEHYSLSSSPYALFSVFGCLFPIHLYATYKACKSVKLQILSQGRVVRLMHEFLTNSALPQIVFTVLNRDYHTPTKLASHIPLNGIDHMCNTESRFDEHHTFKSYGWRDVKIGVSLNDAFTTQSSLMSSITRYQDEYYLLSIDECNDIHNPVYICLHKDAQHYEKLKAMLNAAYVSKLLAGYQHDTTNNDKQPLQLSIDQREQLLDHAYKLTESTYSIFQTALERAGYWTDTIIVSDDGCRCNWYMTENDSTSNTNDIIEGDNDSSDTNTDSDTSHI